MSGQNVSKSVFIAHPDTLMREGLAGILRDGGFEVTEQVGTGDDICKKVLRLKPGIVLVDWNISESCVDVIQELANSAPDSVVVVLTRVGVTGDILKAVEAGAKGYLSVNLSPKDFLQSLEMIIKGNFIISQDIAEGIKKVLTAVPQSEPLDALSEREREILKLICFGSTNREIAQELFISEHTVKVHLRGILNKLNLRNRQQAVAYAVQSGLMEPAKFEDINASQNLD